MVLGKKGFSLIEILLVIVLLAVVAAMSTPSFTRSFSQLELKDAANNLAYLMRYAQSRSIYSRRQIRLSFDPELKRYWLEETPDLDVIEDEGGVVVYRPVPGRFGRRFRVPEGITVHTESPAVVFSPDGRIQKTQIDVCRTRQCLIISTQNQSGQILVEERQSDEETN